MSDRETIQAEIRAAFATVEYPGDWCLRDSNEGDEPFCVERDFKGRTDWRAVDSEFLDQAPDGLGSALSFFSDEAFHFYLPAYMIADLDEKLERSNPVFHLTHGLDDSSRRERINPRRYGDRTWFDYKRCKLAMFTRDEAAAIVGYLKFKAVVSPFERKEINEALQNFWNGRIADGGTPPTGGSMMPQTPADDAAAGRKGDH